MALLELRQRYAGSMLGSVWVVLYPLLFLSIYLFLYLVIFRVRFPGYSELRFVVFVFAGLVPFLAMMESITRGANVIKENVHLIKNVIVPVELLPLRLVLVSFLAQLPSFGLLLGLAIFDGDLSPRVLLLPIAVALVMLFVLGIVLVVAALGVLVSDVAHVAGLVMTASLFLTPIAFRQDMVPATLQVLIYANPFAYALEWVRWTILDSHPASVVKLALFPLLATGSLVLGAGLFRRFKGLMADHV